MIVATGASPSRLEVPGEDRLYGRGVSFCGTCDGPFYKDQIVAAVGGGDTAMQESICVTKIVRPFRTNVNNDKKCNQSQI
jgi:thioredoxin reductase (NADPH)